MTCSAGARPSPSVARSGGVGGFFGASSPTPARRTDAETEQEKYAYEEQKAASRSSIKHTEGARDGQGRRSMTEKHGARRPRGGRQEEGRRTPRTPTPRTLKAQGVEPSRRRPGHRPGRGQRDRRGSLRHRGRRHATRSTISTTRTSRISPRFSTAASSPAFGGISSSTVSAPGCSPTSARSRHGRPGELPRVESLPLVVQDGAGVRVVVRRAGDDHRRVRSSFGEPAKITATPSSPSATRQDHPGTVSSFGDPATITRGPSSPSATCRATERGQVERRDDAGGAVQEQYLEIGQPYFQVIVEGKDLGFWVKLDGLSMKLEIAEHRTGDG